MFNGFKGKVENIYAIRGWGGHLVFPIGPRNTNVVEDVKFLLPVKFQQIPFSDFREEVENVSANQRPCSHLIFFRSARKIQTLVEEAEFLSLFKFRKFRSVVLEGTSKCFCQAGDESAILLFYRPKTQTW